MTSMQGPSQSLPELLLFAALPGSQLDLVPKRPLGPTWFNHFVNLSRFEYRRSKSSKDAGVKKT